MSEANERKELFELNKYVLYEKIMPYVKNDDLRIKVEQWFMCKNIEFYPMMPTLSDYDAWYRLEQQVKEELKRIDKEHYVRLFDK
jgi:hypothetical protein